MSWGGGGSIYRDHSFFETRSSTIGIGKSRGTIFCSCNILNLLSMGIRNGSRLQYSGYRGHNFWTPSPITNENQRVFNISRHNISSPLHKEFWIMRGLIFWRYDILKPLRLEYYKEIGLGSIFRNQYILYPLSNSNGNSEGSYFEPQLNILRGSKY